MIYMTQLLQAKSETDYDVDEGQEEAEWKKIDITLGEGEPQEEALEDHEDNPADDKISSM